VSCSPELARPAGKAGCRLELQLLATWRRAGRALKSGDVESVHAFRAAQRRLETALRVFHGGSAPALPRGVRRFLKRLGQRAGVCRDLDVQLAWLAGALARLPPHQKPGARWMMARLEAKRDKALTRLQRELKQGRARSEHRLQTRIKALGSLKARKNRLPTAGALVARTIAAWSDQLDLQLAAIHSLRDWSEAHRARMTVKRIRFLLAPFAEGMRGAPAVIDRLIVRCGLAMARRSGPIASPSFPGHLLGPQVTRGPGQPTSRSTIPPVSGPLVATAAGRPAW